MTEKPTIARRYRVLASLGKGAAGVVYKARDTKLDNIVALKLLHRDKADERAAIRFQREAKAASNLHHPGIANVLDFGVTDDGTPYMVSDFIEGTSLKDLLAGGPLELSTGLGILRQIAACMTYVHEKGVVHRDLKPGNILLNESGEAFVVDFGIAKTREQDAHDSALTAIGTIVGSPYYISPDQARELDIDHRSDIYSLGCVAFEIFSGKPPYRGETVMDTIRMHVEEEIPLASGAMSRKPPDELDGLICKMLAKTAEDRIQSMEEVGEVLEILEDLADQSVAEEAIESEEMVAGGPQKAAIFPFVLAFIAILIPLVVAASIYTQSKVRDSTTDIKAPTDKEESTLTSDIVAKTDSAFHMSREGSYIKAYVLPIKEKINWSELEQVAGEDVILVLTELDLTGSDIDQIVKFKNIRGLLIYDVKTEDSELRRLISSIHPSIVYLTDITNLTNDTIQMLCSLDGLVDLCLSDCNLTDEAALTICKAKRLVSLNLNDNRKLSGKVLDKIVKSHPHLMMLQLRRTRAGNDNLEAIGRLKKLSCLEISKTLVTDEGLRRLTNPGLRELVLDDLKLTDRGLTYLEKVTSLRRIYLSKKTATTSKARRRLQMKTGCRVLLIRSSSKLRFGV